MDNYKFSILLAFMLLIGITIGYLISHVQFQKHITLLDESFIHVVDKLDKSFNSVVDKIALTDFSICYNLTKDEEFKLVIDYIEERNIKND